MDSVAIRRAVRATAPDRVFHLAADASVAQSWEVPGQTIRNNVVAALNLLEAVRLEAPQARTLMVGSGDEYGIVPAKDLPIDEARSPDPRNPYALSKVSVGALAAFYAETYGLTVVRARAFNHFGPGQSPIYVVASLARQIAAAEEGEQCVGRPATVTVGDLDVKRDFTDVRDVVRAYWALLEHGESTVYNVCSGQSTRIGSILDRLADHSTLDVRREIRADLVRSRDARDICGSSGKLLAATNWRPRISLDQTLRETLGWWRDTLRRGKHGR
jgi:GDP-4-dehydro-6-deoxy-D-mannose reductase